MGFVFSSGRWMAQLLRPLVLFAYRAFLDPPGGYVVLENRDDRDWLIRERIVRADRAVLIRGAGVDPDRFFPGEEDKPPMVVMVARLLNDKGVGEFVEAAQKLRQQGHRARFIVVGDADMDNPGCVPPEQIAAWKRRGVVEFWGWRDDVSDIYRRAAIACLPSYREGLPKVLLEAAACGLPIVATDVPGCREIVAGGVNGDLVPPRDADSLAASLDVLLSQPDRRRQFGDQSRRLVMEHFTEDTIAHLTVGLYRRILQEAQQAERGRRSPGR
jgi:glycosyltransferase involved in cell wall biosynthesis